MLKSIYYAFTFFILLVAFQAKANSDLRNLEEFNRGIEISETGTIFIFEEELNQLRHDFEPWKKTAYQLHGEFWITNNQFSKLDTLTTKNGKKYESKLTLDSTVLLRNEYGKTELAKVSQKKHTEQLLNTARYTPNYLVTYFKSQSGVKYTDNKKYSISILEVSDYALRIFKNLKSGRVERITAFYHDDLYGDVTTTFRYGAYQTKFTITYPSKISIEKLNGKVIDHVNVTTIRRVNSAEPLIDKPNDFKFKIETLPKEELIVSKHNDYIYFIDLLHTDDKVMVVEFKDYVLVAEAPVNSRNGELIIGEVKKLIPNKPIKYFVFGHHHPHYLGGLRAFVHQESTVLCVESNKSYVEFIATAAHTLEPDSLEQNPKPLQLKIIKDSLTIGDKGQMKIYFIGEKSKHTNDYLIYYFPNEQLLFQDDLCWISNDGQLKKAGDRQAGLHQSIVDLNLEVDTIIQSWPVAEFKVKTKFSFQDLENSVQLKE